MQLVTRNLLFVPRVCIVTPCANSVCWSLMPSLCSIARNSFRECKHSVCCSSASRWTLFTRLSPVCHLLGLHLPGNCTSDAKNSSWEPHASSYLPGASMPRTVRLRGCTEQKLPPTAGTQSGDQLLWWETKSLSSLLLAEGMYIMHPLVQLFQETPLSNLNVVYIRSIPVHF